MSDFGDTTGMQNPIFKIMNSQATGQQGQQMNQNPMNLNPNSMMQGQMGMGMPNQMNSQMMNQQGMDMNQQNQMGMMMQNSGANNNPMGQTNDMMNNMQQMQQSGNQGMGMNPMMNQMNSQMMMNNQGMNPNMGMNPMMQQNMGMNPMMQQQMAMNPMMMMQNQMGMGMGMTQAANMQNMQNNINMQNMQNQMQNILNNTQVPAAGAGNDAGSQFQQQSSQASGPGFSVIFRASGATGQASAPIMVQCMPDDKVSDVIEKYRNKANDRDPSKKFIFNAKNLSPSLSVAEAGITNNANIFVVTTKGVKGAF